LIYHGHQAVLKLREKEGAHLTPEEWRVVMLEGYATEPYTDTKGILTCGVGQTGEWLYRPFKEAFAYHVDRVRKRLPLYESYPSFLRCELMQAEYRGDLGLSPKAVKLMWEKKWEEAAEEFLDNNEYRKLSTPASIKKRMEALYHAIMLHAKQV